MYKGMVTSNQTLLKQEDDVINNEEKGTKFLNNAYTIVVEITTGKDNFTFSAAINTIFEECRYRPSVLNIRKNSEQGKYFSFSGVTSHVEINKR